MDTAFEILAALSFCHLLNDMMQSLIPAIYPILKENFQGVDLNAQYGVSEWGDYRNRTFSALLGGNFAEGRGNAMLGIDFSDRGDALQIDRPYYRKQLTNPYGGLGGTGSGTTPKSVPAFFSRLRFHGPFSIMAACPSSNCVSTSPWPQFNEALERYPF